MEVVHPKPQRSEAECAQMRAELRAVLARIRPSLEWAEIMQVLIALHRAEQATTAREFASPQVIDGVPIERMNLGVTPNPSSVDDLPRRDAIG